MMGDDEAQDERKAMRGQANTYSAVLLLAPALLMLNACGEQEAENPVAEPDAEAPEAQPTASIFGPEAELPEPEGDGEIAPSLPLKLTIGFPDGGADLDADAIAALDAALPPIKAQKTAKITLGAHSDAGGDDAGNLASSEKRGLAVAKWLIDNGVDEAQIEVIAFGEQNPLQPNALPDGSPNELGRAANRRVELVVAAPRSAETSD
jgi:OOP family OmpA-OmpF porin